MIRLRLLEREKKMMKPRVHLPSRSLTLLDLADGLINCKGGLGRLFVSTDQQFFFRGSNKRCSLQHGL